GPRRPQASRFSTRRHKVFHGGTERREPIVPGRAAVCILLKENRTGRGPGTLAIAASMLRCTAPVSPVGSVPLCWEIRDRSAARSRANAALDAVAALRRRGFA